MNKRRILLFAAVFVLALASLAVLTWSGRTVSLPVDASWEAAQLAGDEMQLNRLPGHSPSGRLLKQVLCPGSKVSVRSQQTTPLTIGRACWLAYVDDMPTYDFAHTMRVLYIDVETGAIRVEKGSMFPQFRGVGPKGEPIKSRWVKF